MGTRGIIVTTLLLSACAHAQVLPTGTPLPGNAWSRVTHPSSGSPNPIGFYSNGCIGGANTLPLDGVGYQAMRPFRNRNFGHPDMIDFVQKLGQNLSLIHSGILVGDMGQPRGGPMPYGHTSHQVGLDVDIWFWTHPEQNIRSLSADERNTLPMPTVLNANGLVDSTKFTEEHIQKLKLSAADPRVERIFVNPAIKTYLCSVLPTRDLEWLHKLRPWPGHDDHFHVRISCPANSKECTPQDPQPAGDGCNELIPPRHKDDEGDLKEAEHSMDPKIEMLMIKKALPATCSKVLAD